MTFGELNDLRDDAAEALAEAIGLAVKGANQDQVTLAAKFAVTAQARYTLACLKAAE